MFGLFKRKEEVGDKRTTELSDKEEQKKAQIEIASGLAVAESAKRSTAQAAQKFAKPETYTRRILDDGRAKELVKKKTFENNAYVRDPYTGNKLEATKKMAKNLHGNEWRDYLAEGDHVVPLKKVYNQTKKNPWLSNENIKKDANSLDNMEVISSRSNNAKRSKSNKEFVSDKAYLEKTKVKLTENAAGNAIKRGEKSQSILNKKFTIDTAKNVVITGHEAGVAAAVSGGITTATMSTLMNIAAVIKGEKMMEDALTDVVVDTGKGVMTNYAMGGGLTTISHTLSSSSSGLIKALTASNVPGQIITAVMITGNTLQRYSNGEISTQECILELGEKGICFASTGYAAAVGQVMIPIPIVGAAVGTFVGATLMGKYYGELIDTLKTKELEHQEREKIIAECKNVIREEQAYRKELETYLKEYFQEYQDCFDEALASIKLGFQMDDTDGIVMGANQITQKLGGKVYYETTEEFERFLDDDSVMDF